MVWFDGHMETRTLAGSDLQVSRACFGTMTFGGQADRDTSAKLIDDAIAGGINFFDTANAYNGGESERLLGELLGARRKDLVLASKVFNKVGDEQPGLSRSAILAAVENSLRRLKTDYLDIYYMHAPDYNVPQEESLAAMDSLVKSGKVRYVAASNYASWQMTRFLWIAADQHLAAPRISQPMYNVIARRLEDEYLPMCKELGVSTICYNPLAGGLLTGKHLSREEITPGTRFDSNKMYQDRYWNDENFEAVNKLAELAKAEGRSLVSLAFAWILHHSSIDCIILGASRPEQLAANLKAWEEGPLQQDTVNGCNDVWQKLKGIAPKYNR